MNFASPQLDGRITYQRSGETFYIPYSLNDVVATSPVFVNGKSSFGQLKTGDRVRFYIAQFLGATNASNQLPVAVGTYYARQVELIPQQQEEYGYMSKELPKQLYRGIITTLKDSFGKIEREDAFRETFFHFHDYCGQNAMQELKLGLNVEFELQDRHGKEIACNIRMLPDGTVSFDELGRDVYVGRIIQPLTKLANFLSSKHLNGINLNGTQSLGRLIYDTNVNDSLAELMFTERDRCMGEYTLLEGDFVQFRIATDKRKKLFNNNTQMHKQPRASQLTLIEEYSLVENSVNTGEHREQGVLVKMGTTKELLPAGMDPQQAAALGKFKYGAIKCIEQSELVYFSFDELINYVRFNTTITGTSYTLKEFQLQVGDSLEFSVVKCQKVWVVFYLLLVRKSL